LGILPAKALALLDQAKAASLAVGDVFILPPKHATYFDSVKPRPGLIVRVQRSGAGDPVIAYLVFGTTERVPKRRAMPAAAGEAELDEDTTFDFLEIKELPVTVLLADCKPTGRLGEDRLDEIDEKLAVSRNQTIRRLPR
jgi:hypothetical protein